MNRAGVLALTATTMVAFSANSVLCRLALAQSSIDPATFTLVRVASGVVVLWAIVALTRRGRTIAGSWQAAFALFAYAAAFSFAYISLSAGVGALLLFGAVQATMILTGLVRGERLTAAQWIGLSLALAGLAVLVAPGVAAPPPAGACLMISAGVAWGAYSLLGRANSDPLSATAGNFLRAAPMALVLATLSASSAHVSLPGLIYAILSGAIASGLGYTLWYTVLPSLAAAEASSVQLSVPVITAFGGALVLGEGVTLRLAASSLAILGGIYLVIASRARTNAAR